MELIITLQAYCEICGRECSSRQLEDNKIYVTPCEYCSKVTYTEGRFDGSIQHRKGK